MVNPGWGQGSPVLRREVKYAGLFKHLLELVLGPARGRNIHRHNTVHTGRYWWKPPRVLVFSKGDLPSFSFPEIMKLPVFSWHHCGIKGQVLVPSTLGSRMCQGIFLQTARGVKCPACLLSSFPVSHLHERFSRNSSASPWCDRRGGANIPTNGPYRVSLLLPLYLPSPPVQDPQVSSISCHPHTQPCAEYLSVSD